MYEMRLEREYLPFGVYGKLIMPNGKVFATVERPWLKNQSNVSCIPEGSYTLARRASGVVSRSSGGEFSEGWEVTSVPQRTYIMLHPANWPKDLEGCIGIGESIKVVGSELGVTSSRNAFREFMEMTKNERVISLVVMGSRMYP